MRARKKKCNLGVQAMKDKNDSIQLTIQEKSDSPEISINPLTMELNGVIDAAVQGGTDKYAQSRPPTRGLCCSRPCIYASCFSALPSFFFFPSLYFFSFSLSPFLPFLLVCILAFFLLVSFWCLPPLLCGAAPKVTLVSFGSSFCFRARRYREAFFVPQYVQDNPDKRAEISRLQKLISKQIEILEMGCMVHGLYCPPSLKPMQEKLETQLKQMKDKNEASAKQAFPAVVPKGDAAGPPVVAAPAESPVPTPVLAERRDSFVSPSAENPVPDPFAEAVTPEKASGMESRMPSTNPFDMDMGAAGEGEGEGEADEGGGGGGGGGTSDSHPTNPFGEEEPTNPFGDDGGATAGASPAASAAALTPVSASASPAKGKLVADRPPPRPSFKSKPKGPGANPPPLPTRDSKEALVGAPPLPTRTNIKPTLSIKVPKAKSGASAARTGVLAPPRPMSKKPSIKNPFAIKKGGAVSKPPPRPHMQKTPESPVPTAAEAAALKPAKPAAGAAPQEAGGDLAPTPTPSARRPSAAKKGPPPAVSKKPANPNPATAKSF